MSKECPNCLEKISTNTFQPIGMDFQCKNCQYYLDWIAKTPHFTDPQINQKAIELLTNIEKKKVQSCIPLSPALEHI